MSDMYDAGIHVFNSWAKTQEQIGEFYARWLGPFKADMTAAEANTLLEGWKLTTPAQEAFMRGWTRAQDERKISAHQPCA